MEFVHLHVHTEYSLLDGANRIKDLIPRVKELGMKSVAITDHGVMFGVIDFYKEAIKHGIKPIIGAEVYMAKNSRFDKNGSGEWDLGHLILLAKNNDGYRNLMKIVSIGFVEGFYYKPRIDWDILSQYSKGLIALSACLSGEIPKALLRNDLEKASEIAVKFNTIFGQDNFYLEIQNNGLIEQAEVNQKIISLSNELGIPLVATNDAHYLKKEDARAHEILVCIQTGKNIHDEDRMRMDTDEFYIKSPDEMWGYFKNVPEALLNTTKIADKCNVNFDFNQTHLPKFDVPDGYTPFEYLQHQCLVGLKRRYKDLAMIDDAQKRLEYELNVINGMGYIDYFLIVWDFIRFAKESGIIVGPGRGSAAGSIAAYSLGITAVDPLKYQLLFERFLNPERISMPDIDIDFCYERRQEVIDYVAAKYGKDRVAQIITFGTMAARAAIRDVGRALNIPFGEVDMLAKMIPMQIGMTISKAIEVNPEIRKKIDEDQNIAELIKTARLLEGMPRHSSTHAAGVVISSKPITEFVPLSLNDNTLTTQFTMGTLEELGLLKMDFLGLRTLTVIRDTINLVVQNYSVTLDLETLPMDDQKVYKIISEGKTSGLFQLESPGMTQFMKELQPSNLEDIIAGISLYRPGPMDQIPRYIENKNHPEKLVFAHPSLEKILNVTYGCMVYQEQVMQIVREIGGYSMGRSDLVRRAMSKKKVSVMEDERKNFIYGIVDKDGNVEVTGAIRNGVDEETASKIFDEMMDFASYAFNKSHAAAYAVVAYQTAYLKCYYPVEFMAAMLNSFLSNSDKVSQYVMDCRVMNIEVLPPDINESNVRFSVSDKMIRFGLAAIKNVGENAITGIIEERNKNGRYKNFREFLERIDDRAVNKRCLESLIKSGAFHLFGKTRSTLISVFEKMYDSIVQSRRKNLMGQVSLFDIGEISNSLEVDSIAENYPELQEYPQKLLLSMEKEMLGLYVSGHPLNEFENEINKAVTLFSKDLLDKGQEGIDIDLESEMSNKFRDGQTVTVAGIIAVKKTKTTRSNSLMAFLTLEDLFGTIEILVFSSTLEKYAPLLEVENVVIVKGRLSLKEDERPIIICEVVSPIQKKQIGEKLFIRLRGDSSEDFIDSLMSMLKFFNGKTPVMMCFEGETKAKALDREYWVSWSASLQNELIERLGSENVKLV